MQLHIAFQTLKNIIHCIYQIQYFYLKQTVPKQGASQIPLVVKNSPANAGDIKDLGSILG